MVQASKLWKEPEVNPINNKARWVPILNPFCLHGRVFFFSWLGFMVCFLSWYAFPPLTPITLKQDLNLTTVDIANGNIIGLVATLVVRVVIGPLCDRFGPRKCMVGIMILGAIPSALAGTAHDLGSLLAIRFFVGILGGSFVPCQVWCTGFFDKNCVGRANALAAGWGNAGGGITYFVMPIFLDFLVGRGLTPHVAWRISFVVVPFVIVMFMALMILFFAPDSPTGAWKDRHLNQTAVVGSSETPQSPAGHVVDTTKFSVGCAIQSGRLSNRDSVEIEKGEESEERRSNAIYDNADVKAAEAALIKKSMIKEAFKVICSLPTLTQCVCYFVTFGCELAINGVLSAFYIQASGKPAWSESYAGDWAAMYGLLNIVARPLGGYIADSLYPVVGVEGKKFWMIFCAAVQGIVLICIGAIANLPTHALIGATAVAAMFTEASNGANFAVVPHVHPGRNGMVSGLTGASGNLGGIVFNLIFRLEGTNYHKSYSIIGAISLILSLSVSWIPVPKVESHLVVLLISLASWRGRLVRQASAWASLMHIQNYGIVDKRTRTE